jgi:hypothetical protein
MGIGPGLSKGEVTWLVREILACDVHIDAGNRESWLLSKRETLSIVCSRLFHVEKGSLNEYIKWAKGRVKQGERPGDLEEPASWIRRNSA